MNNKLKKSMAAGLATITLITPIAETVHAAEVSNTISASQLENNVIAEKTNEEIQIQMQKDNEYAAKALLALESNTLPEIQTRAGGAAVAKLILKAWDKLPYDVKVKVAAYGGLSAAMKILNTLTAAVENMVYAMCKKMEMSNNVAWWVTKAIMLVI